MSLPGGTAAIREPSRTALSYLQDAFGEAALDLDIPFARQIDRRKADFVATMIAQRINSPLTSSCGRLFDAVAALIGIRHTVSYEAQAAAELEMHARSSSDKRAYSFEIYRHDDRWQIGARPLIRAIVADLKSSASIATISRRFHNGLAETLALLADKVRASTSLNRVCLSGGTFQSEMLLEGLTRKLQNESFEVFTHSIVPAGDGGLSLCQAAVAAHVIQATPLNS